MGLQTPDKHISAHTSARTANYFPKLHRNTPLQSLTLHPGTSAASASGTPSGASTCIACCCKTTYLHCSATALETANFLHENLCCKHGFCKLHCLAPTRAAPLHQGSSFSLYDPAAEVLHLLPREASSCCKPSMAAAISSLQLHFWLETTPSALALSAPDLHWLSNRDSIHCYCF